jgi:hypothetical protein
MDADLDLKQRLRVFARVPHVWVDSRSRITPTRSPSSVNSILSHSLACLVLFVPHTHTHTHTHHL